MNQILRTFVVLLSHWQRQPIQFIALFVGLVMATALWSGVQALNSEARASYAKAANILGGTQMSRLVGAGGTMVAQSDYIQLRRAGWRVSPVLEGKFLLDGRRYRLIGIDPLTLPQNAPGAGSVQDVENLTGFLTAPYQILASTDLTGDLPDGMPPITVSSSLPPGTLLTDIGQAQRLLNLPGALSYLIIDPQQKSSRIGLDKLGLALDIKPPENTSALSSLTESFHLNLTAFGFLSFVVGLFIVHATIGLAFEQRRPMFRTLRALGVSLHTLLGALLLELLAIATLAGLVGIAVGYAIAAALLPDVAASLRGLYGADVTGSLSLSPTWWLWGLGMSYLGAALAAFGSFWRLWHLPVLAPAHALAWMNAAKKRGKIELGLAVICALAALTALLMFDGLIAGFVVMGGLLMTAVFGLPMLLSTIITVCDRKASGPRMRWFWADTQAQLGGLSLSLAALLLALSVNIGVGTMVNGFRQTFLSWLDQRLVSELYVRGRSDEQAAAMRADLVSMDEVRIILPIWGAKISYEAWPVTLFGILDDPTYRDNWPILTATPDVWERLAAGNAVMISEQFAQRFDLALGDKISLPGPTAPWQLPIAGIYADYGNPGGHALVAFDPFLQRYPDIEKRRFGVRLQPSDVPIVMNRLETRYDLEAGQLIDQSELKAFSRGIFEKTFAVTTALNALTLAVAGIALLTSLLTLAQIRLPQLATVWALGMTRRQLGWIELVRSLALAMFIAVLAIPVGLAVAWVLTNIINVAAFGWKLPVILFPMLWVKLGLLAIFTAGVATLWPVLRLQNTPPMRLLGLLSDER